MEILKTITINTIVDKEIKNELDELIQLFNANTDDGPGFEDKFPYLSKIHDVFDKK